jgi:hypothetical protein
MNVDVASLVLLLLQQQDAWYSCPAKLAVVTCTKCHPSAVAL